MKFMFFKNKSLFLSLIVATSIILTGCGKDDDIPANQPGPNVTFFGLTSDNRLLRYNGQNTGTIEATITITGLQSGETIAGIDFRPATGQLFGIGTTSRLYIINVTNGAATAVGTAPFTPAISGTPLGFDFNPTVDRIRLVTSTGQNLRLNPENGAVAATDGTINGATGASITGVAYTQNLAGAASTVLYDIDVTNNKLYRQMPPNDGTLVEVGNLGVDPEAASGFDISSDSANALAALTVGGRSGLYTINLSTGAATKVGDFATQIIGLAIPTQPTAYLSTTNNNLIMMNPMTGTIFFTRNITGLQTGENILGIDMRPATGQLFALGSTSRLYTINASTGAATSVGILSTLLVGTEIGFDFNPTVDRIRIVSNTGQNLRVNPADAVAIVDGIINPATNSVSAAAYTNNFAGATTTVLFDIDATSDRLLRQDPPNNGTLVDVGALGVNVEASNGFDIGGSSGMAYGIFTVGGTTRLYAINTATGAATTASSLPAFTQPVRGFTLGIGF